MDSNSARVELDTGRSWLRPKLAGRAGNARCRCEMAGRGLGSRIRDLDVDACLVDVGGGAWEVLGKVVVSVDTERMMIVRKTIWGELRRAMVESMLECETR